MHISHVILCAGTKWSAVPRLKKINEKRRRADKKLTKHAAYQTSPPSPASGAVTMILYVFLFGTSSK